MNYFQRQTELKQRNLYLIYYLNRLVAIDEADFLSTYQNKILYSLCNWPTLKNAKLIMVIL